MMFFQEQEGNNSNNYKETKANKGKNPQKF